MDSDQRMYKLRNGSDTAKWAADRIEELEGLLAEKLDAYKLGLDTAKRAYQDERDEYEATIKRMTDAIDDHCADLARCALIFEETGYFKKTIAEIHKAISELKALEEMKDD